MLDTIYMQILDMSKTASIVILVVLLARLLLKKAPKVFSYALWAVVLFRLLCPFSVETPVSIVPEMPSVSQDYTLSDEPISVLGASEAAYQAVGDALNGGLGVQHIRTTEKDETGMTRYVTTDWWSVWILFGQYVWVTGMGAMLIYSAVSYWKIRKMLAVFIPLRDNILIADDIKSPFVMGLFHPKIYLPCNLGEKELEYIILHEQHHIKRLDHIVKALAFLALTVHWFNPLVWLAFILASKDMEMSCDEAVIHKLGSDVRADYSASLLTLATGQRIIAGTPLAFGEGDPKGRINNLAKWKMPALWVVSVAVIACIALAVVLVTNPKEKPSDAQDDGFYLLVGAEGVTSIGVSMPGRSGGVINADGSEFRYGEKVWLESLQGVTDLRGVTITASGSDSKILYSFSVPENASYAEIKNIVEADGWLLAPDTLFAVADISGKTFVYEKDGFFGTFAITLNEDGTFSYYEGAASSYIGRGKWECQGDIITLTDDVSDSYPFVNRFQIAGDDLIFIEKESSNFLYIKVKDGERFHWDGTIYSNEASDIEETPATPVEPADLIAIADLDHDQISEDITLRETEPGCCYELSVVENGSVLWTKELSTAHAGWNTIMLYSEGAHDYLVEYTPYMNQGIACYTCTVFSLEDDKQTVTKEYSVRFELPTLETAEMKTFAEEVGILLRNCAVLVSTELGILINQWTDATELPQIYPVRFEPGDVQAAIDGVTTPRELTSDALQFPDTPLEFLFTSGAGAWGTTLTLQPDGSFAGSYSDADMGVFCEEYPSGTCYVCEFSGRFTDIQQINDYTWLMKLSELTTENEPGEVWIADQIQYIASDPYGLTWSTEFLLYAPRTPIDEMLATARSWWPNVWLWRKGEVDTLDGWGLCGVSSGAGFFTS